MAYNLQPLIQILEQILNPQEHRRLNWSLDPCKRPHIESLLAKAHFLNDVSENPSPLTGHAVRRLENRIRDAACQAQDVIESHLVDLILKHQKKRKGLTIFPPGLLKVIEHQFGFILHGSIIISPPDFLTVIEEDQFQPILDEMAEIIRDGRVASSSSSAAAAANLFSSRQDLSTMQDLNSKTVVVGIDEDIILLKELLVMSQESKLEVIPIVGMGGIGKTTLARTLYDDGVVASHFHKRAWIVISQSYSVRGILSGLLECITGNEMVHQDCSELGLQLHKILYGRRYLIVLDDMWSSEAWDCIKMFFPDENNGSRILVTTREQNVAKNVGGFENCHHQMKFLNEIESWELLRQTVYPEGQCPLELENVGKNIAEKCRGLPLAISVVGGILSLLDKTPKAWMQVAEDVSSFLANEDERISNILSLSYNQLPDYLKPCLLYIGAFPEDFKIKASKLIRLWMAEGFIKTIPGMSPEETAREYLMELVQRNLLSIDEQGSKWNAQSYTMHDLLRDLCIRKAQEEKFLYVGIDAIKDLSPKDVLPLRLSVLPTSCDKFTRIMESSNIPYAVRSLLLFPKYGVYEESWIDNVVRMRLLKVLDVMAIRSMVFPKEMERLVNLRYLAAYDSVYNSITLPISSLCNLQTLVLGAHGYSFEGKVKELFDMTQLRHIKFKGGYPHFHLDDWESVGVAEQLQTLSNVSINDSFPRIMKAIPNLKKLGIHCGRSTLSSNIDLSLLIQLQILKCYGLPWSGRSPDLELILPPSLKKLTLYVCDIPIRFMDEIGRLPNLQVLKLDHCELAYGTREWKPTEGQFQQLRFLLLKRFAIRQWIADETHYPRLEHLIIQHCIFLEGIPSAIADIPTLKLIEVKNHITASALESARKIQVEQIEYGNDALEVRITLKSHRMLRKREIHTMPKDSNFKLILGTTE